MGATVEVDRWRREFEMEWNTPYLNVAAALVLKALDEGTKAELRRRAPGAVEAVEELGGVSNG